MKIKIAVSNLLIWFSPIGITMVCTGEKCSKVGVPKWAKIAFLTHFLL